MQATATNHFVAGADPSGEVSLEDEASSGGHDIHNDQGNEGGSATDNGSGDSIVDDGNNTAQYLADGVVNGSSTDLESMAAQTAAAAAIYAQHNAAVQHFQQQQNAANGGEQMLENAQSEEEMSNAAAVVAAAAAMQQQGYSPAEALQYAYQTQMAAAAAADGSGVAMQYPFAMGLGSLQLAQMGSLLQAGQQYALLSGTEDAVYVNQKQFHRILKRRQARMKLEAKFKIMPRKEWLHDSRHNHAKKRQRGPGGRFLSKAEREKLYPDDDFEYGEEGGSTPDPSSPASSFVG